MLQYIRDELTNLLTASMLNFAANGKNPSLQTFPVSGRKNEPKLLKHFGSITRLRSATVEELTKVEGIGPKTATRLTEFLTVK